MSLSAASLSAVSLSAVSLLTVCDMPILSPGLSDETKYNVGGKSMSHKELMEELAKAEKAMAAMETTEA